MFKDWKWFHSQKVSFTHNLMRCNPCKEMIQSHAMSCNIMWYDIMWYGMIWIIVGDSCIKHHDLNCSLRAHLEHLQAWLPPRLHLEHLPAGKEYKDCIILNLNDSKIKTRNDERCSKMFQMAAFCDILRHSPGQDVKFRHPKDLANGAACCHAGSNIFKTIMSYQNIST